MEEVFAGATAGTIGEAAISGTAVLCRAITVIIRSIAEFTN